MRKIFVSGMLMLVFFFGISGEGRSQNHVDKIKTGNPLSKNENISRLLIHIKEQADAEISARSERDSTPWFSNDPADLQPLADTIWEFTYTLPPDDTRSNKIGFLSDTDIITTLTGVALYCIDGNGNTGLFFFTDLPSVGTHGFFGMLLAGEENWIYEFIIDGGNANGYFIRQIVSTEEITDIVPMTGIRISPAPDPSEEPPVSKDDFEDDNTFKEANLIVLNDTEAQPHTFHETGDQDWIRFYGLSGESGVTYTTNLESGELASDCHITIALYDTDGTSLLASEKTAAENPMASLYWTCRQDGIYYVSLRYDKPEACDAGTAYDLRLYTGTVSDSVLIKGVVTDFRSGKFVKDAKLRTNADISALSRPDDGEYAMTHPPGTYTLTVEAEGYNVFETEIMLDADQTVTQDIIMIPIIRGDLNADQSLDLADAVLALRVVAGINTPDLIRPDYAEPDVEVNNDKKVGLEEAVYIVQTLGEI